MPDSTKVHIQGNNKYAATFYWLGGSGAETDAIAINRSALTGPGGTAASVTNPRIRIDEITWSLQSADSVADGLKAVIIEFDDGTDEIIAYCGAGDGYIDFRDVGGFTMSAASTTAAEGDVLFSTLGATIDALDTYMIQLKCTIKSG